MLNRDAVTQKQSLKDDVVFMAEIKDRDQDYVYKKVDLARFKPDSAYISVAAATLYQHFLGSMALPYELVVNSKNEPEGMISIFTPHTPLADEDFNLLSFAYGSLLSKDFGKMLAISYCLEEDDLNGGNFAQAKRLIRIDYDLSLIRLLSQLDLVSRTCKRSADALPVNPELLHQFPFISVADEDEHPHSPTQWIADSFSMRKLLNAFKALEPMKQMEFISGMQEGFEAFASFKPETLRETLSPLLSTKPALLEALIAHLALRVKEVAEQREHFAHIGSTYSPATLYAPAISPTIAYESTLRDYTASRVGRLPSDDTIELCSPLMRSTSSTSEVSESLSPICSGSSTPSLVFAGRQARFTRDLDEAAPR